MEEMRRLGSTSVKFVRINMTLLTRNHQRTGKVQRYTTLLHNKLRRNT